MTETEVINQVQALHGLIRDNYSRTDWNVLTAKREPGMIKLQILLGEVFPNTKRGRIQRLETMVAVMPLFDPGKRPIEFTSSKVLWLGEIYAWLSWLDDNGGSTKALQTIAKNPQEWATKIRRLLPYIQRPEGRHYAAPEQEAEQEAAALGPLWAQNQGAYQQETP